MTLCIFKHTPHLQFYRLSRKRGWANTSNWHRDKTGVSMSSKSSCQSIQVI